MRGRTLVVSLLLHAVAAALVWRAQVEKRRREATIVEVVRQPPPRRTEAPKPAPPPTARAEPRRAPPRRAAAVPEPPPPAPSATAVSDSPLIGDSGGPGIAVEVAPAEPEPPPAPPPPPPPPAPRPKATVCTEPASRPVPLERPRAIEYVDAARLDGAEGRLLLRLHVDGTGLVTAIDVVTGVHPELDAAASAAVRTWRFRPATRCGKPITSEYLVARRFELGD